MNQWLITALGMGTVFIALIVLSLILSGFPLVFKRSDKVRAERVPLPALSSRRVFAHGSLSQETVAVIAAAIAEASGMSPGQFRITGITPAEEESFGGFSTPIWGHGPPPRPRAAQLRCHRGVGSRQRVQLHGRKGLGKWNTYREYSYSRGSIS